MPEQVSIATRLFKRFVQRRERCRRLPLISLRQAEKEEARQHQKSSKVHLKNYSRRASSGERTKYSFRKTRSVSLSKISKLSAARVNGGECLHTSWSGSIVKTWSSSRARNM